MAKVPTARSQRIGTRVSEASQTPFQSASTNIDMFGGAQARQMSQLGKALSSASAQFEQAQAVIQNREDAIARSREYGQFFTEMSDEFDRVQAESDMTSSQTIADYNQLLDSATQKYLSAHASRSPESYARFAQQIESARTRFATSLTNNVRNEQRAFITNQFEEQYRDLAFKVQNGEYSLEQARIQSDQLIADIDPALPNSEVMGLQDSAEQALAIGAMNRFANAGQYEEMAQFMNSNPAIVASLPNNVAQKYTDIIQQARAVETRERAKFAAMEDQYREALGLPAGARLPTWARFAARGISMPKAKVRQPLTAAGKMIADRQALVGQYGADSPQVKMFDRAQSGGPKPNSPLGKLIADERAALAAGDTEAANAYRKQINAEDPSYERMQELRESFATVQSAMTREEDNLNILQGNVGKILQLVTGVQYTGGNDKAFIEAVRKKAAAEDFEFFVTGLTGKAAAQYPGSTAAEIEQMMKQIQGHIAFGALQRMRESSPHGGALGNVSNFEIDRLQAQMGALDFIYSPVASAQTLIQLFDQVPRTIDTMNNAFQSDYAPILGGQPTVSSQDQPEQGGLGVTDLTQGGAQPTTQPAPAPAQPTPAQQDLASGAIDTSAINVDILSDLSAAQQIGLVSDFVKQGMLERLPTANLTDLLGQVSAIEIGTALENMSDDEFSQYSQEYFSIVESLINESKRRRGQ